ncbi:unnamed protein product [Sympodiomycopsis kandeliae]
MANNRPNLLTPGSSRLSTLPLPSSNPNPMSTISQDQRISEQIFNSSVSVSITLAPQDLPSGSEPWVYYTKSRRNSYLPLLLREIKDVLIGLADLAAGGIKDEDLWFEYKGVPLKWHWPIGLLYDHLTSNLAPTAHKHSTASNGTAAVRPGMPSPSPHFLSADYFQNTQATVASSSSSSSSPVLIPPAPSPWPITLHLRNLPQNKLPPPISNPIPGSSSGGNHISSLIESVKHAYMANLKESDFIRNGNTKKVNALRRSEQDGIWEAIERGDFTQYSTLITKIAPPSSSYNAAGASNHRGPSKPESHNDTAPSTQPVPSRVSSLYPGQGGANASSTSLTPSALSVSVGNEDGVTPAEENQSSEQDTSDTQSSNTPGSLKGQGVAGLKSIPVKFILQGGTILQECIPPLSEDGKNATKLYHVLQTLFPALFPSSASSTSPSFSLGLDFSSTVHNSSSIDEEGARSSALAIPIIQGIRIPFTSTMLWLNKCLADADGWLNIVLLLLPTGDAAG